MPLDLNLPKKRLFKRPASLWKRLLAFIIDLILIQFLILLPFEKIFSNLKVKSASDIFTMSQSMNIPTSVYYAFFFITVLALLYFAFFEYYLRQTIGMTIFGIYADGEVTFWKAIIRNAFIIPAFPFYILWIIEPIHLLFYKTRALERFTSTSTVEVLRAY
jgi:uncharacterized RDD family membrane protein YckC